MLATYTTLFAQNTFPANGNVGINTLSPVGNFQVMGDGGFDGSTTLLLTNNSHDFGRTSLVLTGRIQNWNDSWTFGSGARNALIFAQNAASSGNNIGDRGIDQYSLQLEGNSNSLGFLSRSNGNNPNMVLAQSGFVGFGITSPRSFVDIGRFSTGQQLSAVLARLPEGDNVGEGTFIGVRGYNTSAQYGSKTFGIEHSFYGQTNNSINFYRGGAITGGEIGFNTNNNIEAMRIDAQGRVGIGTSTPKEALSVNGRIRSKEVKVEVADWPDYVFDEKYQLPDLEKMENYIKTNKRLPGMPSAKDIAQEGLALGEVVKIQQEKIEELTLLLIELNKRLIDQGKVIRKLSKD